MAFIISFEPLWETMKKKGVSTYTLIKCHSFSKGTLDSLKHDRNVTTATLNDLCEILGCELQDVAKFVPEAQADEGFAEKQTL